MITSIIDFCNNLKQIKIFDNSQIDVFDLNVIDINKKSFYKLVDEFDNCKEIPRSYVDVFLVKNEFINKNSYFLNYKLKENSQNYNRSFQEEVDYNNLDKNFDIIYLIHIIFTFLKSSRNFNEYNFDDYFRNVFFNRKPEPQFYKYEFSDIDSTKNEKLIFQEFFYNLDKFNDPYSYQFYQNNFSGNWYYIKYIYIQLKKFLFLLSTLFKEKNQEDTNNLSEISNLSKGMNYENECKILLEQNGWNVSFTPISNDNGADLVATKGIIKIVIQCKNYSGTVGNAAIQEVYSAKSYYKADKALVVSENGFTSAASDLANNLRVTLIQDKINLVKI